MFSRKLDPRGRDLMGLGADTPGEGLPRPPEGRYVSLKDELEQTFFLSRTSPTYEGKLASLKRFVRLGASMLPAEEGETKENINRFIRDEVKPFRPKITPIIDDKQSIYEINESKVHIDHYRDEIRRQKEQHAEENWDILDPVAMQLAAKLQGYGLMSWKVPYRGGNLGAWAKEKQDKTSQDRTRPRRFRRDMEGEEGEER